jgi:7-cyano-7-deazaguanine synthase
MKKAVYVNSGGIESTVLSYLLKERYGAELHALIHRFAHNDCEVQSAIEACGRLNIHYELVDMSTLLDDRQPRSIFVPVVVAYMLYFASVRGAETFYIGYEKDQLAANPNINTFLKLFPALYHKFDGSCRLVDIQVPFKSMGKADVVRLGSSMNCRLENSWSCSQNLERHCGACANCKKRKYAFLCAGVADNTEYLI